jgi:hypothetical protein
LKRGSDPSEPLPFRRAATVPAARDCMGAQGLRQRVKSGLHDNFRKQCSSSEDIDSPRRAPPAMADASPAGALPFGHQVGREAHEKERLAVENFDLRLQVQSLESLLRAAGTGLLDRRTTAETFYDFSEEDAAVGGGGGREDLRAQLQVLYDAELDRYKETLARFERETAAAVAAAAAAEKEAEESEAAAREARQEVATERRAAEDAESERRSACAGAEMLRVEAEAARAEADSVRGEAERLERRARLRASGLEMQVGALEGAIKEARCGRLEAEAGARKDAERARKAEEEVESLRTQMSTGSGGGGGDGGGGCGGACMGQVQKLESELEALRVRYEATVSNVDLRRKVAREAAAYPAGAENQSVELSVPGFELYRRLCKKVAAAERSDMVVLGGEHAKQWRTVVLNEMNDSLVMLYRQTEKLEDDRAQFIEKHCRALINGQKRAALKERNENSVMQRS